MQQTEKYQFNLIEGSDLFLPDALNENMEKAEQVLAEHRAEASDAVAELTASTAARFAVQPRVEILTWTGDGARSRTLTFQFQPKVVLLFPHGSSDYLPPVAAGYGVTYAYRYLYPNSSRATYMAWNGNSVTLSDKQDGGTGAFNSNNGGYLALAIG